MNSEHCSIAQEHQLQELLDTGTPEGVFALKLCIRNIVAMLPVHYTSPPLGLCMQGFPDDFQFWGNVHNKHRQIGNAVPPPLAASLGHQLRKALELKATKDGLALLEAQM